jgi:hypothetical protein
MEFNRQVLRKRRDEMNELGVKIRWVGRETKLWSGPSLKREYEIVLEELFEVEYCFCVSEFLQKKILSNVN